MGNVENAKIKAVTISMADHGCLTFGLILEGDYWGCTFGGYRIGHGYLGAEKFEAANGSGLVAMMKIMNTVGVERWEDLQDKYIRVVTNGNGPIHAIGNIIEDKWFNAKEFFESYEQNTEVKND